MKNPIAQLIRGGGRHRKALFAALLLLEVLAAAVIVLRGRFTNDMSRLFPDTKETRATFDIIHNSHLADTVQLEFVCDGDVTKHADYLEGAAMRLEATPGVKQLTFRYRSDDLLDEAAGFSALAPRFFTPEILDRCDPDAAAAGGLKLTSGFAPNSMIKMYRSQPFGWDRKLLADLQKLDDATGMRLDREFPYFVSADRRRAMIVVETDVRLGDAAAVRKLFAELRRSAGPLPGGMKMNIISGCSHSLGNEEVLKRDAAISGAVSLLLFLLLFLWFYRGDRRALWIPAVPLYASLLSLAVMTLFFREICLYVVGLGGCITGLAVDQGIHVYAAFRGEEAEKRTAALAEPMLLSTATSFAVFVFLAFTGIAAYIQMAVFAGLALIFSAALALLVLPQLLDRGHRLRRVFAAPLSAGYKDWAGAALAILAGLAIIVLPQLIGRADFALDSLDGTPESILKEERDFRAAWRDAHADTAVLAAGGDTAESALERLESAAALVRKRGVSVAMPPRPSEKLQKRNREMWRTPETARKIADLEERCRAACRRRGLNQDFFAPFFKRLRESIDSDGLTLPPILTHIDRRMIKSHGESAAAVALMPDDPETVRIVRRELRIHGDGKTALLSKTSFKQLIGDELGGRFRWMLPLSVLAALAMLFAVFRRPGDVLLAMVPVTVAFSGVTLLMYVTGFRVTPAAAFALVLLTGLSVDYGIYAVSRLRRPGELDTDDPILLSAATTVAGAGALLASRHPALFGTGVVLAPGIALACASGIFLVPMLKKPSLRKIVSVLVLGAVLAIGGSGCVRATPWEEYSRTETVLRRMHPYPESGIRVLALTTVTFSGDEFRFMLAAELDERSGKVRSAGVDPGSGVLLFKYDGDPNAAPQLGAPLADDAPQQLIGFLKALPEDLRRIFLLKNDIPLAVTEKNEYITVDSSEGAKWKLYDDGTAERNIGDFPFRKWRTVYRRSGDEIEYSRFDGGNYTLKIKVKQCRQVKK